MAYSAKEVANRLLTLSAKRGKALSLMQVLKLVYFAHGWCLALRDEPLINEPIAAWKHGPVIESLYFDFRHTQGAWNLVPLSSDPKARPMSGQDDKLLGQILDTYGNEDALMLSYLTHIPDGPWDKVRRQGKRGKRIPNALIKEHFQEKQRLARENERR